MACVVVVVSPWSCRHNVPAALGSRLSVVTQEVPLLLLVLMLACASVPSSR